MSKKNVIDWAKWASIATLASIIGAITITGAKKAFALNDVPERLNVVDIRMSSIETNCAVNFAVIHSELKVLLYNQTNSTVYK